MEDGMPVKTTRWNAPVLGRREWRRVGSRVPVRARRQSGRRWPDGRRVARGEERLIALSEARNQTN